jgi:glutaredoxin|tara:strand:+ start:278 stop:553 length:276 start_codon:yes stop_codon:yes gene_type:complete
MTQTITELTFYTTDGCHLCEQAKSLLQQLLAQYSECYQIEIVDIVESESLIEKYGTRIPVLADPNGKNDLGWPFDYPALLNYLQLTASHDE